MTQAHSSLLLQGPAILVTSGITTMTEDGVTVRHLSHNDAPGVLRRSRMPIVLHGPMTARRLGTQAPVGAQGWRDVLELFLFIYPTRKIAPTLQGLCDVLDIEVSEQTDARILLKICAELFQHLKALVAGRHQTHVLGLLKLLAQQRWAWHADILSVIGKAHAADPDPRDALRVWRRLRKWEDAAPRPPPTSRAVSRGGALRQLLKVTGPNAESRPAQHDYASVACSAFTPREAAGMPELVLAEAGTGTGKTAGYLAPATLWAEENGGTVWISTYTRHLQSQIERELHTLYPDRATRRRKVVVRKGRENYLCLLNFEDAVNVFASRPPNEPQSSLGILLAFVARWAEETEDGDLIGGDLPGWFSDYHDQAALVSFADRRGECIYSACPHHQTCFVEHSIRRAMTADIVIANHALVMAQSAWALQEEVTDSDDDTLPTHYVFDEGHHLPDAADNAFSVAFSGLEASELRRWLLGAEGGRSRARGLRRRMDDLVIADSDLERCLLDVLAAAQALPSGGWLERLQSRSDTAPSQAAEDALALNDNPSEAFLQTLFRQLRARTSTARQQDDRECDLYPQDPALMAQAEVLRDALLRLKEPLERIATMLAGRLADTEDVADTSQRIRLQATARTLKRRAIQRLDGWIALLGTVAADVSTEQSADSRFIDIIRNEAITHRRFTGTRYDIGIHRHWRDPTIPFAMIMQGMAHGLLVTSATLRDQPTLLQRMLPGQIDDTITGGEPVAAPPAHASPVEDLESTWHAAEQMIGASHFLKPAIRAAMMSPYDYGRQTRAFIVTDVSHRDIAQLAAAFQTLFVAAGGGALGLFTAISRLRQTYKRLAPALEAINMPLYAQHVDQMDSATLVDIFRSEVKSCLLGTDAMRDGIDVKGNALRLVVFEKTPWPRPDILHRERRRHAHANGLSDYDDRLTRMRIRQGFGRLIRASSDRGVFVMLDRQFPSRLLSAFPEGVTVERMGLRDVAEKLHDFLHSRDDIGL